MTNITTITICLDTDADPCDYPWYVKVDGEQIGHLLDVARADADEAELLSALHDELPGYSDAEIKIWRSGADD